MAVYVLELAGEDDAYAVAEASNAAASVERFAPGLALARSLDPDRLRGLAFTRAASELIGRTTADIDGARALLESSPMSRSGTVAVRARDVRGTADIDTRSVERVLGDVLTARGLDVDLENPDHELRASFAGDSCVLGWLAAESRRDYGDRRPTDKPFFQPGSMDPLEARAVANLAGAGPGVTVLDPLCGTGGLLVEAGLLGATVIGVDAQAKMVRGASRNFARYLTGERAVVVGDAVRLPIRGPVDAIIADVPYGRQSRVAARGVDALLDGVLTESARLTDRAVIVIDRERSAKAREAGWTVAAVYERRVHRSLSRFVHVLTRT